MALIVIFLLLISITGWSVPVSNVVKLSLQEAVFTIMAAMGCLMMLAFIAHIPVCIARFLVYGGWGGLVASVISRTFLGDFKTEFKQSLPLIISMITATLIMSLMAWGLQFSSIDDYSFWGTISRFLFVFNQLPENADFINASFLQYTPGLACFHYLFYQLAGFYTPMLNYVAQDLMLLAPLLLFIDDKRCARSIAIVMIAIVTLYLAYGNILAKLEVDATVAMWFFAMLWTAIRPQKASIWVMLFGLVFLSIIKEIGLLFSIFVAGVYFVCHRRQSGQTKKAAILIGGLLLMKLAWLYHVKAYGFVSFAAKITLSNALTSLIPGHPEYGGSQALFLKGLLSGNFDHILKMPFAVLFILSGWQIHRLSRLARLQPCHIVLFKAFSMLLPFYIINLYWLQAIVFRAGYQQAHLLDFPRYFNMAFVPFILSVLAVSVDTAGTRSRDRLKKLATVMSMVALIFIVGGKIERTKKYYHPFDYNHIASVIQKQSKGVSITKPLCLYHVPTPDYQVLMPLQYLLMPQKIINIDHQRTKQCGQLVDFILLNA